MTTSSRLLVKLLLPVTRCRRLSESSSRLLFERRCISIIRPGFYAASQERSIKEILPSNPSGSNTLDAKCRAKTILSCKEGSTQIVQMKTKEPNSREKTPCVKLPTHASRQMLNFILSLPRETEHCSYN